MTVPLLPWRKVANPARALTATTERSNPATNLEPMSAVGTGGRMIRYLTLALALLAAAPAYGQTPPYWSPVMPAPPWWNADIDKGSAATRTVIYNDRGGNLN